MPDPSGRPREFDKRVVSYVDEDTKAWLAAMSKATGESEAWVVRAILNAWRAGETKLGTTQVVGV